MACYGVRSCHPQRLLILSTAFAALLWPITATAQNNIVPDNTLGPEPSALAPFALNPAIDLITGGAVRDQNLFHSFEEFNIGNANGAYFIVDDAAINNIFSRVTGNNLSDIQGVLGTRLFDGVGFAPTEAHLYIINPNGVIFGENAALDVGGSFTATTASSIQFGEVGSFSAVSAEIPEPILQINPSALYFHQAGSGDIVSRSTRASLNGNALGLQVPDTKTLTLLGGDITIDGGGAVAGLHAWGGRVFIGAFNSEGSIGVEENGRLKFPPDFPRANILITNQALIDVSLDDGGDIFIDSSNLYINSESQILAGIAGGFGSVDSLAGDIIINATGDIDIDQSFIVNDIFGNSVGSGGDLIVSGNNLFLSNGAQLSASTLGIGSAGSIILNIQGMTRLDGVEPFGVNVASGIFASVEGIANGDGGSINIETANLELVNGGQIIASTRGIGNAGNVVLNVADSVRLDGVAPNGLGTSGIFSTVNQNAVGDGGNIFLSVPTILVTNGAALSTSTFGQGHAGNLVLYVADGAYFDGVNPLGPTNPSGAFVDVGPSGAGNAGDLRLTANVLEVTNGAQLGSSSFGQGNAGSLILEATHLARFDGVNRLDDRFVSGAYSDVSPNGIGDGGFIFLTAQNLEITDGAELSTSTFGQGNAGEIVLTIGGTALIDGINTLNGQSSGIFSRAKPVAMGSGSDIFVISSDLILSNGAVISTANEGTGDSGKIQLLIYGQLTAIDGTIETTAIAGSGGQVDIAAQNIILIGDSDIQTFVDSGAGGGGDIAITADFVIALDDSDILAFASDGRGGNIDLSQTNFFGEGYIPGSPPPFDGNDRVDINASGGLASGTILVPDTSFVENSLNSLPDAIVPPEQLLAGSCIARSDDNQGSFVMTGGDGLPSSPQQSTAAAFPTGSVRATVTDANTATIWQAGEGIAEPTHVFELADGRLVLSHFCE